MSEYMYKDELALFREEEDQLTKFDDDGRGKDRDQSEGWGI